MTKIQITEQNQELYQTLCSIKKGNGKPNKKSDLITAGMIVASMLALTVISLLIISSFGRFAIKPTIKLVFGAFIIFGAISIPKTGLKLNTWLKVKAFKKEHPEIVTNISVNELEKELVRHKELTERAKRIKTKIPYCNALEKTKDITPEERLNYLKKERESIVHMQQQQEESHIQKTKTR